MTGELGDELGRLVGAAQQWARSVTAELPDPPSTAAPPAAAGATCGLCPVCRALDALRSRRPDIVDAWAPVLEAWATRVHDQVSVLLAALVEAGEHEPGDDEETEPDRQAAADPGGSRRRRVEPIDVA